MTMQSGRGIDPRRTPFLQTVKQRGDAAELIKGDNKKDIALKLYIPDIEHANDLAITLQRCRRYNMPYHEELYLEMAKWQASVGGHQAKLFSLTSSALATEGFFDGKPSRNKRSSDDEPNK